MQGKKEIIRMLGSKLPYLRSHYGLKRIGLFGSYAKSRQKKGSDIDIFVEFEKPVDFEYFELIRYLEKALGKKIDIVTSGGLRGIRLRQVANSISKSVVYV